MVMLDVPSAVNQGESVELSCIYELENDRLYSIKWYRNDVEFYRYVPNDWPPGQFLPLPGVKVDLSKSGQRSVYLRSVDLNSTGTYRCEVSAEAPSFQSVEAERDMKVMVAAIEEVDGKSWTWVEDDDVEATGVDVDIFGFRKDESG
ncbi:uncharacterized protein TNCV_610811 [Trichonephila clavipes]|nr:uncharacterized protein TNCV_610811 [Trichonephila clavipes]